MATYSIKDLEKISGIKAHTIRIWEKRYGLVSPSRTNTNIRFYTDSDLRKLLNISILARNGIKISKIATLCYEELNEKVLLFSQKNGNTENIIESLIIAMIELDENKFDRILSNLIIKLGFEEAFTKILNPFFDRVGLLWQTGTILPAQEHFISNLVRQKLVVAIDSHRDLPIDKSRSFILFLPEGEMHELGLLFYQYSIRKRGFKTLYLGQSVPLSDLVKINEANKNDYFLTSFTISQPEQKLKNWITQIGNYFPGQKIFITGLQTENITWSIPENVQVVTHPGEFMKNIDSL